MEIRKAMETIDIRQITIGGEIGRRIDVTAVNNLLALNVERDFLSPFQEEWHNEQELGDYVGLGKLIDALARLAAYKQDAAITDLRERVISQVVAMQEADGYIGIMPMESRFNRLWDIHEISYLIVGLVSDYRYWHEIRSLHTACQLADYLMKQWKATPEALPEIYIGTLGSEEAFLALYEQTNEPKYLAFLTEFRRFQEWERPIVKGRLNNVEGHVYDYLSRLLVKFKLHAHIQDNAIQAQIEQVMDFMLNQDGMVITGVAGENECWQDTQEGLGHLGETCSTAYWIFLLDMLMKHTQDASYGDVMERTIYNGLFAAQSPDGRKIRYYVPFDGQRRYFHLDTYCCPNNYRRIISALPEMVYYRTEDGVAVNLYTASEARFEWTSPISKTDRASKIDRTSEERTTKSDPSNRAVTTLILRQETDYPRSGHIKLHIDVTESVQFVLKLRIPKWCKGASVSVNDEVMTTGAVSGKFLEVDREWSTGDQVKLELPMPYRLIKGRKAQSGRVAVMRGPIVYCLNPAKQSGMADMDLRLVTCDTSSIEGEHNDGGVMDKGSTCCLKAWGPYRHGPENQPDLDLVLTEFPDPNGQSVYFRVADPSADHLLEDELTELHLKRIES
ncbi:hypothetical protein A8709_15165 [Paenibacillus pectinilyticus]|uniref:Glycosyl hydrolase n=1 Tax=Paenibacillus pectinilyticus TaxID=512399 RepID=A0A1C1A4F3_9BACL|nr:beta-L-arabinofuranosidase domain-containing protein [Paenibacillus pectinilyticus]OCT15418.1 hypothetical protein A8709_15165 [Paenibacillus pectinilyticus]